MRHVRDRKAAAAAAVAVVVAAEAAQVVGAAALAAAGVGLAVLADIGVARGEVAAGPRGNLFCKSSTTNSFCAVRLVAVLRRSCFVSFAGAKL